MERRPAEAPYRFKRKKNPEPVRVRDSKPIVAMGLRD
jgi:hypothetical protein